MKISKLEETDGKKYNRQKIVTSIIDTNPSV